MCCIRYYFLMTSEEEWLIGSYHKDIHNYLRLKERKRFIYRGQSPQLHLRKSMIEWMNMICLKMEFCTSVQHLAVYLLDIFMDNHTIYDDHLRMVIIGCLMVADPAFINFTPSLVAASCIASTRICLTITPCWSKHLENLTNYKYPQLKPYVEMLLNALDTDLSTSESHCSEINGNSTPVSTKCIAIT
uniref:Cyclin-J n=1 Tax=Nephila pilipes TaxID=299642 RepID=A0A8X6NKZ6_NEPPI|nr:cyclin-J [Nephila pilipes]